MAKLICMRGYPGSGKSTRAEQIRVETGAEIVNRDKIRMMLLGVWFTGKAEDEDRVTVVERAMVDAFLSAGKDVVVDATHLNPAFLRAWAKLAWEKRAEFEVRDVKTLAADCIDRDVARGERGGRAVGAKVIERMARRFPMHKWPTVTARPRPKIVPYDNPADLPEVAIFDVDGTLTTGPLKRSPYDYSKVHLDVANAATVELARKLSEGRTVIILSGRDDDCRGETELWLMDGRVPYADILMRDTKGDVDAQGNKLSDVEVKYRLFNEHIRGVYNVTHVFDDRLQVCELWHELGLPLFRVGDPNANF